MSVIKPAKLITGDTIAIVASSLPVLPSFKQGYKRGKQVIYDLGFRIYEGKTINKTKWWMAASPKEVAEDINAQFADKDVKAIIAQTGGYSAFSVLEYLDYELITHNPKPFIGMSDVTNYHIAMFAKSNLIGFHMDDVLHFQPDMFAKFLTKTEPVGIITPLTEWEEWKEGQASGHLIGGNLHLLANLIGTPYFPSLEAFTGAILFWEEVGEPLHNIARFLTKLKYAGVLDKIAGMLIGKITYIKPAREKEVIEPTVKELVLDVLKDYHFPIMAGLDFGHFTVNIPMPTGIKVSFDTSKKELTFLEGTVI